MKKCAEKGCEDFANGVKCGESPRDLKRACNYIATAMVKMNLELQEGQCYMIHGLDPSEIHEMGGGNE